MAYVSCCLPLLSDYMCERCNGFVRLTPTMATFSIYEGMIDIAGNQNSGGGGLMFSVGLLKLCLWSIFAIYDGNIAAFIYFFGRPTRS